jgi:hypothetical protein
MTTTNIARTLKLKAHIQSLNRRFGRSLGLIIDDPTYWEFRGVYCVADFKKYMATKELIEISKRVMKRSISEHALAGKSIQDLKLNARGLRAKAQNSTSFPRKACLTNHTSKLNQILSF